MSSFEKTMFEDILMIFLSGFMKIVHIELFFKNSYI